MKYQLNVEGKFEGKHIEYNAGELPRIGDKLLIGKEWKLVYAVTHVIEADVQVMTIVHAR